MIKRRPNLHQDSQNGIRGWLFSAADIQEAKSKKQMLMLDFELGVKCRLCCPFCFRKEDERDGDYPSLDLDQTLDIIDQANKIGCKSIHIVGQGEPTEDPRFFSVMDYVHELGMIPLVFTSGYVMGDDELAGKIHNMTGQEMAQRLNELDVSVILKLNSLNDVQDKIVGNPYARDEYGRVIKRRGSRVKYPYTKYRNIALRRLIDVGLNEPKPTRLGADILILKDNYKEVFELYTYCRKLNIYPLVVTFIPCGRTTTRYERNRFDVSPARKIELWKRIYQYNAENGITFEDVSAFAGGHVCRQTKYALYVNVRGQVYRCPGERENIGALVGPGHSTLARLWKEYGGTVNGNICPPRIRCGSLPVNLQKLVRDYIENELSAAIRGTSKVE